MIMTTTLQTALSNTTHDKSFKTPNAMQCDFVNENGEKRENNEFANEN